MKTVSHRSLIAGAKIEAGDPVVIVGEIALPATLPLYARAQAYWAQMQRSAKFDAQSGQAPIELLPVGNEPSRREGG